jgi:hypothetical protein
MNLSRSRDGAIPCLVLTHGRDDIMQESLASIVDCDARLEIDVVHNPSATEEGTFLDAAKTYVSLGKIHSLTVFDENISNNAVLLYLIDNLDRYSADRVVISDGDIVAPPSLIEEQLSILDRHSQLLACGLRLDASAWHESLSIKKDLVERFNTPRFEEPDFVNTATGMWMTMFRGPELASILRTIVDNRLRLTDGHVKNLGAALFQKQWVATKDSIGRELNRERPDYYETKAVSTQGFTDHSPEPPGSNYATWNHDWVVPASRWQGDQHERVSFEPLPPALPRFRGPLDQDPVVDELSSGRLTYERGYLANHLMRASRPGLAFVVCNGQRLTGLPRLADRSALFISTQSEPGETITKLVDVDCGAVLIGHEAQECRSILTTMQRFVGAGTLLHGIVFRAEAVRHQIAAGDRTAFSHMPSILRRQATVLAGSECPGALEAEIESLVGRLWSDEALANWYDGRCQSLDLSASAKNPHFAYFRVKL